MRQNQIAVNGCVIYINAIIKGKEVPTQATFVAFSFTVVIALPLFVMARSEGKGCLIASYGVLR